MSKETFAQHAQRHIELHRMLDELVADWMTQTGKLPSNYSVMDLMKWVSEQTVNPSDVLGEYQPRKEV